MKKIKIAHILIVVLGIIYILIPNFHTNIWFDESYSVAISRYSFYDIWRIGGNDVHPVLYYWMLHLLNIIFGNNILVYRLFSSLAIILLGILGYTHIRKEFGEKTGLIFSFLVFFMPIMNVYSGEIRMYAWTALFVLMTILYAYRIITKEKSKKDWILFSIFSLATSYMHYYGLMAAGLINLFLCIYILISKRKDTFYIKAFFIQAIIEVVLYIPWLMYFMLQLKQVHGGFWISVSFPATFIEVLNFHFKGNIDSIINFNTDYLFLIAELILYVYIGYLIYKRIKNERIEEKVTNIGSISLIIYIEVVTAAAIISIFMPILYPRYIFTITGLLYLGMSYFLAEKSNNYIITFIMIIVLILSIITQYSLVKENYSIENDKVREYINSNFKDDDIIIYYNQIGPRNITRFIY